MKRVEQDGDWTLFSPDEALNLHEVYGDEFEALYERYEKEGRGRKTVSAQKLWYSILDAQIETGSPFICYKDAVNSKHCYVYYLVLCRCLSFVKKIQLKESWDHQIFQSMH